MLLSDSPRLPPLGVVLAGGPGLRMGGDKPRRLLAGRRLIDLALEALAPVCPDRMIVTGNVLDFADLPVEVVADRWPGQGPMAALVTAFRESEAESLLLLPVDLPLVKPELLRLILATIGRAPACGAMNAQGLVPMPGLYRRACLPAAERLLAAGERRLRVLLRLLKAGAVPREEVLKLDPDELSFFNLNYPEDLAKAERLVAERGIFDTPLL